MSRIPRLHVDISRFILFEDRARRILNIYKPQCQETRKSKTKSNMNQMKITHKRRRIDFHLSDWPTQFFKEETCRVQGSVCFKVFFIELSVRFFYSLINSIYTDCQFAKCVYEIFLNNTRDFVSSQSGRACRQETSISIVLDQKFLQTFSEFVSGVREEMNQPIPDGNFCLKLTGVNLTNNYSTDRSG